MPLILLAGLAYAGCRATVSDLDSQAQRALAAYAALDLDTFRAAEAELRSLVGCLCEPATADAAWELHVVHGLAAWVDRDTPAARVAFRGARAAADRELSVVLAPEGSHPRVLWAAAGVDGPGAVADAPAGRWSLDGQAGVTLLPVERAALVQRLAPDGGVEQTWYFPAGVDAAELLPRRHTVWQRPRLVAGGALALGGGAALVGAAFLREAHREALPANAALLDVANIATGSLGIAAVAASGALLSIEVVNW